MQPETIFLIATNIVVPVAVAIITAYSQSKKYKKEINLLNVEHENKLREQKREYEHKIEILKLQYEQQQALEQQKSGQNIVEMLTEKLSDEIIKQPATQKMISQKTTRSFVSKRRSKK